MTERVVDQLELIEVEEEHRQAAVTAPRQPEGLGEAVLEQDAVRQTGQGVVIGLVDELALGVLAPRDVEQGAFDHRLRLAAEQGGVGQHPDRRAVTAPQLDLGVGERAAGQQPLDQRRALQRLGIVIDQFSADAVAAGSEAQDAGEGIVAFEDDARGRGAEDACQVALEQRAVALRRGLQRGLGAAALGDLPEAPDTADRLAVEQLRHRVALDDAAVGELQHVEALGLGRGVQLVDLLEEGPRVAQAVEDGREQRLVLAGLEELRRDLPDLRETPVVGDHLALAVDHQDAVGGRLERRAQQRQRVARLGLCFEAPADVVDEDDAGRAAGKDEGMRGDLDHDHLAVFLAVRPLAVHAVADQVGLEVGEQGGDGFRRPDVVDGHRPELVAGVAVELNGGLVDGEEAQGLVVVDPHRQRVALEQQAVLLFGVRQAFPERHEAADLQCQAAHAGTAAGGGPRHRMHHVVQPDHLAGGADQAVLDLEAPPFAVHLATEIEHPQPVGGMQVGAPAERRRRPPARRQADELARSAVERRQLECLRVGLPDDGLGAGSRRPRQARRSRRSRGWRRPRGARRRGGSRVARRCRHSRRSGRSGGAAAACGAFRLRLPGARQHRRRGGAAHGGAQASIISFGR